MITDEMQASALFKDWLRKEKQIYLITGLIAFGLGAYNLIFVPNVPILTLLFTLVSLVGGISFCSSAIRETPIIKRMLKFEPNILRLRAIASFVLGIFAIVIVLTYPIISIRIGQIILGILFLLIGILTRWRKNRLQQLIDSTNPSGTPL